MGDLPSFADQTDFENASRGFVAALSPGKVSTADGRVIWDCEAYRFVADELRGNLARTAASTANKEVAMALSVRQLFDSLAVSVDGPRAWDHTLTIDWNFTDLKEEVRLQLANGVLTRTRPANGSPAQLRLTLTKPQLLRLLATQSLEGIEADGDASALATLLGLLDTADAQFAIVTP